MLRFREYCKLIDEGREEDDAYYRSQGWDGTPEDRVWFAEKKKKSTTEWTLVAAVKDILGDDIAVEWNNIRPPTGKQIKPGKIYIVPNIRSGGRSAFIPNSPPKAKKGKSVPEPVAPGGIIFIPKNILGRNSDDLTITVHEAYHALLFMKAGGLGQFHGNEKVVNDLAEKWLKKHLKGFNVQVAMDTLGVSRKGYGINKAPYVQAARNPKEMPAADAFIAKQSEVDKMHKQNAKSKWLATNPPGVKSPRSKNIFSTRLTFEEQDAII